jgi:S-DNA-T family DNA segregation ATPase FtsK/SpoIIIE
LVLGLDFASLAPSALDVPDGEHAIILGPARSGRSTALIRAIAAFRAAQPTGSVIVRCPRRNSPVLAWVARNVPGTVIAADDAAIVAAVGDSGEADGIDGDARVLIAVDDAERVDDVGGDLFDLVSARHHHVLVVAAGRPDALRSMYGHWTTVVRRSRIGLVMTKGGEADGELLGEILPRRQPVAARPGLAWVFDGNGRRLVQVARDVR